MKNLATKNREDFTVTESGEAFVSHRKTAELSGVRLSTLQSFFRSKKIDISQGVSSENLDFSVSHYATKGRPEAVATLIKFARAGAQAYIYTEAGYVITVAKPEKVAPPVTEVSETGIKQLFNQAVTYLFGRLIAPRLDYQDVRIGHIDDKLDAILELLKQRATQDPIKARSDLWIGKQPGYYSLDELQAGIFMGVTRPEIQRAYADCDIAPVAYTTKATDHQGFTILSHDNPSYPINVAKGVFATYKTRHLRPALPPVAPQPVAPQPVTIHNHINNAVAPKGEISFL